MSTSKEQGTIERGSGQISKERSYFKRIPMPVMANCRHSTSANVSFSTKHNALHQNVIFTIIVLIILSISKSYSALPTDLISRSTTVSSVFQPTSTKVNLLYDTKQYTSKSSKNKGKSSASEEWTISANSTVTSVSIVSNSSVFNIATPQSAFSPTATVTANPLQINGSLWSINNATKSGGDHWHQHHSDLISHLHCEVSDGQKSLLLENKKRSRNTAGNTVRLARNRQGDLMIVARLERRLGVTSNTNSSRRCIIDDCPYCLQIAMPLKDGGKRLPKR